MSSSPMNQIREGLAGGYDVYVNGKRVMYVDGRNVHFKDHSVKPYDESTWDYFDLAEIAYRIPENYTGD